MAKIVKLDDDRLAVALDVEKREIAITLSSDGEIGVVSVHPVDESESDDDEYAHSWIAEGLGRALSDPDLFEEIKELVARAHALPWGDDEEIGPDEIPEQFQPPRMH